MAVRPAPSLAHRAALYVTLLLLVGVSLGLLVHGWSFYKLGLEARVEHPDYPLLKPSGLVGHGYGIAGTGVILTNLLYLVRRRLPNLPLGSMRAWLDVHVFTGLFGSALIVFHSAFQLRSGIATSTAVSLAIVVVTGILGRFLFALSPKPDAAKTKAALDALDQRVPGVGTSVAAALHEAPPFALQGDASLLACLLALPRWRKSRLFRRERVGLVVATSPAFRSLAPAARAEVEPLVAAIRKAASAEVTAVASASLLRSWRSLHRFFAILLVLAVIIHIAVAWYFGYRWILDE